MGFRKRSHALEQLAAGRGFPAVEAKCEFIKVVVQLLRLEKCLVRCPATTVSIAR
jgi:hypothetical protein